MNKEKVKWRGRREVRKLGRGKKEEVKGEGGGWEKGSWK